MTEANASVCLILASDLKSDVIKCMDFKSLDLLSVCINTARVTICSLILLKKSAYLNMTHHNDYLGCFFISLEIVTSHRMQYPN